jgi:hypothetical protein
MWYGSAAAPVALFGPTRYQWDNGYFSREIERRVGESVGGGSSLDEAWSRVDRRLLFYDYVGNNPAKGGLFRAGAMNKGEGVPKSWVGHPSFSWVRPESIRERKARLQGLGFDVYISETEDATDSAAGARRRTREEALVVRAYPKGWSSSRSRSVLGARSPLVRAKLSVRRLPSFFETFPLFFEESSGALVADIPFRRAESRFSVEQLGVSCVLYGGERSSSSTVEARGTSESTTSGTTGRSTQQRASRTERPQRTRWTERLETGRRRVFRERLGRGSQSARAFDAEIEALTPQSGIVLSDPSAVKQYARRAQLGEIFEFERRRVRADGVFRSSPRGWFTFAHAVFSLLFFFGHLWHGGRALFRDVYAGIGVEVLEVVQFGAFQKLGDSSTKRQMFL